MTDIFSPESRAKLREAVKVLSEFAKEVPGGCSYWTDHEGFDHVADIGYVTEFLEDLELYLENKWIPNSFINCSSSSGMRYKAEIYTKDGEYHLYRCYGFNVVSTNLVLYIPNCVPLTISFANLAVGTRIQDLATNGEWVYRSPEMIFEEEKKHEETCTDGRFYYLPKGDESAKVVPHSEGDQ